MNSQARDLWRERADQMRARELQIGDAFSFPETSPRSPQGDANGAPLGPRRGVQVLARLRRRRMLAWSASASVPAAIACAALYFLLR